MAISRVFSDEELAFSIVLQDPYLFAMMFWTDEFRLPTSVEQRILLTDISQRQLLCTARKIGKTLELERDVLHAIVMRFLDNSRELKEAIFITPREVHLTPTRDRIFSKINNTPFFASLIKEKNKSGGGSGVIESINGFKWHFRIEGGTGGDENVVGIRAHKVLQDESAFGSYAIRDSLIMTAYRDATWKMVGVPNGIRNSPFFELDHKDDKVWSRHKYPTYINPLYADAAARDELIATYGGVNTQGYKTQVLGEWGDEMFSSFPPGSIAIDEHLPKLVKEITEKQILSNADSLSTLIPLPIMPEAKFCIGLDYGHSPDPTEIIIAYTQDEVNWKMLARITLIQVKMPIQARFLDWLCSVPLGRRVIKLSTDSIQLIQTLTDKDTFGDKFTDVAHFANPGGTTAMTDPTGAVMLDANGKEIKKRNKQYYTDELKQVFYNTILDMPYTFSLRLIKDPFLVEAISGMSERKTEAGYVVYECAKAEEEHSKDALLYLVASILASHTFAITGDWASLSQVLGWVGPTKGWVAPWQSA